jgi:CRP-like cAMP-binding protein
VIRIFEHYCALSKESKNKISEVIQTKELPKKSIIHKQFNVCNQLFYIKKGVARIFYYKRNLDITDAFITEGQLITAIDSFFSRKESLYNIELLEDSIIETIHIIDLEKLFITCPEMDKIGRLMTLDYIKMVIDRVQSLQFDSAKKRYEKLLISNPTLINRVSLGQIASYLGITQETLSRIRGKK